jgi:hypothetical protein
LAETAGPLVRHDDSKLIQLNSKLIQACKDGSFARIREAIESGADPNLLVNHPHWWEEGKIPVLAYASMSRQADLVECLLKRGATVQYWMLMDAYVYEREAVIRTFAKFVVIDTPDPSDGSSLLHSACRHGKVWDVNLLIELGADVNRRMNDGCTCLIQACAAQRHQTAIMRRLLDEGGAETNPAIDSTRVLLDLVCRDEVSFDTFCLLMNRRPALLPHAKLCLIKLDGDLVNQKRKWAHWATTRPT